MELRHIITQAAGASAAGLCVWWAVMEMRRDWSSKRIPLLPGPLSGRMLLVVLGALASLVPIFYAILVFELVPKGSPVSFAAMLAWLSAGFIGALLAAGSRQIRSGAAGWLTVLGDDTLRVAADEGAITLKLRAGSVRMYFIDGPPQYVQLRLSDGDQAAHLWGRIAIRDMKLVTQGQLVPAQGLMIGSSMRPLCNWLRPFVTTE